MSSLSARNLLIFTSVISIWAIVMGFIGPFYVLQVEKLSDGMEKLGIAFSIMVLLQLPKVYLMYLMLITGLRIVR
ncbi:MAG: hypothetical protein FJ242_04440 [Nitrospira sp.]|nr:hypothetical protein [Nitrospira sp.]